MSPFKLINIWRERSWPRTHISPHPRAEWLARPPRVEATVLNRAPDHIVVHHTASENATDLSLEHALALSRAIQDFHMDTNGWDDIGPPARCGRSSSRPVRGVYGLEPHAAIVGHRDYNATACPGDALYALLPRLRNQVAESLGERRPAEAPAARSGGLPGPRFTFDHGPAVGPGDPTR
ncbi:hypothetical protein [Actinomadura luteofluorescens]|uniref:peptidoglycan recognition protein family protein n=1 Tax=Actinomadura luteofluorescens TaxID=46163 RepID=UPI0030D627AC